ncbi:hypothetical protein [Paenibacillus sp. OAE614]|uniref:hypothetical protein n=1 Tax=Paenibacillus sp. OAE614 TaxID=2663804 RepID=UPI00178B9648
MLITRTGFARTSGEDGIVLEKRAAVAFVPGFPPWHVTDREIWGQQRSEERSGIGAVIEAQHLHLHDLPNERLQGSTYAFTRSAPKSGLEIQWSAERTESFWRSGQRSPLSPDFHLGMLPIREIWGQQRSEERSGIGAVIEAQHLASVRSASLIMQ